MKFEDLKKVNEKIKTVDIKGKEYAEVNQKVLGFRELFPAGYIITEILSHENGVVVMKATVGVDDKVLSTGIAYEKENSSFINKTSYIENCETSAVGRALSFLGIGIDTSIASAEEVRNAIKQQEKATKAQIDTLKKLANDDQVKVILDHYHIKKLEELTKDQASGTIKQLGGK